MKALAWLELLGVIALETALVFLSARLLQCWTKSGIWRRTIWQVTILTLAALVFAEVTGVGRGVVSLLAFGRETARLGHEAGLRSTPVEQALQVSDDFRQKMNERLALKPQREETGAASTASPTMSVQDPVSDVSTSNPEPSVAVAAAAEFNLSARILQREPVPENVTWWPGLVWLLGAAIFGVRSIFIRSLLLVFRVRNHVTTDAELKGRVRTLASRLGMRRSVRLMEFPRIAAPVAFGVVWPTIGLPRAFTTTFSPPQQDAMLTHEIAHLAARDPLWHGLADFVASALWWHPLAWLARRQLHSANESAADEATVMISDGPKVLAECLVELGGRLTRQPSLGWLSMAGFRSHLGHRVERLIHLQDGAWTAPSRLRTRIAKTAGPVALVATGIFSTAWIPAQSFPNPIDMKGESSMKTIKQYWLSSVANVALVATLGADHSLFAQAQPDQPKPAPPGKAEPSLQNGLEEQVLPPRLGSEDLRRDDPTSAGTDGRDLQNQRQGVFDPTSRMPPEMRARYGLNRLPPNHPKVDPQLAARYGLMAPGGSPIKTPVESAIQTKLENIRLSEVVFDSLPLSEVLKSLYEESKKRDPDKEGINFLITRNIDTTVQTVDPTTGLPVSPPTFDMDSVSVKFNLPLRNVRLIDVLNAIVKVAEQPVKYSVEEFGVVFSPDTQSPRMAYLSQPIAAEPNPIKIRTFKVDPNAFLQGLEGTFGIGSPSGGGFSKNVNALRKLELQLTDAEEAERQINKQIAEKTATADDLKRARTRIAELESQIDQMKEAMRKQSAEQSVAVQDTLRRLFNKLGVNMDAPQAVFYNPVTGIVMVKVSAKDMEVVQAALETLGGTPISTQQTAGVPRVGLPGDRFSGSLGSTDKIPVLGDLPFVGRLFRSESRFGDGTGDESRR